jgi:hypothetical protein
MVLQIGANAGVNENSQTYASWNWLANGAGVANTDGSISSTVSANTTSGFSIVSYTSLASGSNYTVGHGLGVAPDMIIVKALDGESNHGLFIIIKILNKLPEDYLRLNSTGAEVTDFNLERYSTNKFCIYLEVGVGNGNGGQFAYCFADVQGFSKFGSYTGNGSTDGTFVYTGFKPAFI